MGPRDSKKSLKSIEHIPEIVFPGPRSEGLVRNVSLLSLFFILSLILSQLSLLLLFSLSFLFHSRERARREERETWQPVPKLSAPAKHITEKVIRKATSNNIPKRVESQKMESKTEHSAKEINQEDRPENNWHAWM